MRTIVDRSQSISTDSRTDGGADGRKDGYGDDATPDCAVVVLANHKGGVTKTTSTANLGVMLAEAGRRVLVVDCDPQANLREAFGWGVERPGERLEDLLVVRTRRGASVRRARSTPTSRASRLARTAADHALHRCPG